MAITLEAWPVIGRRSELELFERTLALGEQTGLLIHGRAGVGKTRLADECRDLAAALGHPTERVVGTRTAALLPLGAVVGLLAGGFGRPGPDGQVHAVGLFEDARRALHERHRGRRLVTVADDIHLLDAASLALLGYLAGQGTIFMIATVRSGEPVPDLVSGLWRDGRVERVDLEDLRREQLDTLLHLALGGPIEAGAGRALWEISQGNPLYVRELVLGALEAGALIERSGVWHLEDRLPTTRRLVDLVEYRIGGVSAEARSVLDRLALCQPVELDHLEAAAPRGVLESLERSGLVTIALPDREVRMAHPLHAEVVRAAMPATRARAILLAEAERLETEDPTDGPAALRVAVWRLDGGGRPDPTVLIRGAHLARQAHDFRLVQRLLEAVPDDQLDALGNLMLGEALYELGDFQAAERMLARGESLPVAPEIAFAIAVARTGNAFWGLCQPETALAIIAQARAEVTSRPFLDRLDVNEAAVLMFSGHPEPALAILARIAVGDTRMQVVRAIVEAPALAITGETSKAVAIAEAGAAAHSALDEQLLVAHPTTHIFNRVFAMTEAGQLSAAEQIARAGTEIAAADRVPIAQVWFAANLGRIAILQGRVATARRHFAEAAGLAHAYHLAGPRRLALSGLALAYAMLGDAVAAERALRDRDTLPAFGFVGPEQQLADAWTAIASRRPAEALARFRRAAAEAAVSGHRTAESWLLHDQMRTGGADASARLRQLADQCDSALVAARARHAGAIQARRADELARAADDFEALGAMLLAAEASAGAAEAFRRAGDQRAATAASRRSSSLAAGCEGAATPGLVQTEAVVPLSKREREIALLAAEFMSSKDIADRLYLSVRTVNNHLQSVYTKLGVTSRADLAQALRTRS